jgi:hypothetical protein
MLFFQGLRFDQSLSIIDVSAIFSILKYVCS